MPIAKKPTHAASGDDKRTTEADALMMDDALGSSAIPFSNWRRSELLIASVRDGLGRVTCSGAAKTVNLTATTQKKVSPSPQPHAAASSA
jgi:hypothetical protein